MPKRISILFLLVLTLILTFSGSKSLVLADTTPSKAEEIKTLNDKIAAQKEKIKQLEETIGKYKKNIVATQTQAVSLKNQLSIIDNHAAAVAADIDLTKEKIGVAQNEIDLLQISIAEKEKVIAKQKQLIGKLIQNLHADDQRSYLEILATNDSFADFYSQVRYLENVYSDLGWSVKNLRLTKEDLDAKKKQVSDRQAQYAELQKDLEQKKTDLDEQHGAKQNLLAETRSSELKYTTLLSSLKKQYQVVENEVRSFEEQVSKKLAEQDKIKAGGDVTLSWPLNTRYITARFHDPSYPFRNVFEHSAIDIRAAQGTPVKAAGAGYVGRAKRCTTSSCYAYVLLIHTGNVSTVYGHLSQIAVADDQFVNRGDIIGYSGATPGTVGAGPFVTGPHLHFEVRVNGIPVDPLTYLGE